MQKYPANTDFFLSQEDWLFGYQHFKLSHVNSNYVGVGMSVDFDNPVLVSGTEKAKWRLDILYSKEMASFVTPLPEHSNQRIQVVKVSLEIPLIIINVYLPAYSLPQQDYDDYLNRLASILTMYETEAALLVSGDFNRSLFRNNPGDRIFQTFCHMTGLKPAIGTTQCPTYHTHNGSVIQIDYFLMHTVSCQTFLITEDDIKITYRVCKEDAIISTHHPIIFEVTLPENNAPQQKFPQWNVSLQ